MDKTKMLIIVTEIIGAAEEIKEKREISEQEFGQICAYAEALTIIKETCSGENLKDIGLDFDIDRRFFDSSYKVV